MSIFELQRVAEPEVMDDSAEVEAYSSAAAQSHLNAIDDTFVDHAMRLVGKRERGRALDIGTGPGQIVVKLARKLTRWKFIGVDRSPNMIAQGIAGLGPALDLAGRVHFHEADGSQIPFRDASFDLVVCNSVLHHLAEPQKLLAEIARLTKPSGAILLRDLRRPGRLAYPFHVRRYGRHYQGLMYKLYCDSVRSAYTMEELQRLLDSSQMRGARVFEHNRTHIGIERPASA